MRIFVKAKPNSKENKIEKIDDSYFVVSVTEPPVKGMANRAIVKLLAAYFKTSAARIQIVAGAAAKNKVIELY